MRKASKFKTNIKGVNILENIKPGEYNADAQVNTTFKKQTFNNFFFFFPEKKWKPTSGEMWNNNSEQSNFT